jgi:hypothetical protein
MTGIDHISRYLIAVFLFAGLNTLHAQQKDFQYWTSAQAELGVWGNLDILAEEEIRFRENCSQLDRQINDLGISYRFNKYLKTSLYYRLSANWKNPGYHEWRQGFYADLSLRYGTGRFRFGYRARFQSARIDLNRNEDRFFNEAVDRHKVTIEYNIQSLPLSPFVEGELFFLMQNRQNNLSDYRAWIGMTYALGKMHKFSLKYGIDRELMESDPLTSYIIALNYTLNLKL